MSNKTNRGVYMSQFSPSAAKADNGEFLPLNSFGDAVSAANTDFLVPMQVDTVEFDLVADILGAPFQKGTDALEGSDVFKKAILNWNESLLYSTPSDGSPIESDASGTFGTVATTRWNTVCNRVASIWHQDIHRLTKERALLAFDRLKDTTTATDVSTLVSPADTFWSVFPTLYLSELRANRGERGRICDIKLMAQAALSNAAIEEVEGMSFIGSARPSFYMVTNRRDGIYPESEKFGMKIGMFGMHYHDWMNFGKRSLWSRLINLNMGAVSGRPYPQVKPGNAADQKEINSGSSGQLYWNNANKELIEVDKEEWEKMFFQLPFQPWWIQALMFESVARLKAVGKGVFQTGSSLRSNRGSVGASVASSYAPMLFVDKSDLIFGNNITSLSKQTFFVRAEANFARLNLPLTIQSILREGTKKQGVPMSILFPSRSRKDIGMSHSASVEIGPAEVSMLVSPTDYSDEETSQMSWTNRAVFKTQWSTDLIDMMIRNGVTTFGCSFNLFEPSQDSAYFLPVTSERSYRAYGTTAFIYALNVGIYDGAERSPGADDKTTNSIVSLVSMSSAKTTDTIQFKKVAQTQTISLTSGFDSVGFFTPAYEKSK